MVGRIGFEPMKAQGQLIYSQPRLTTSLPARVAYRQTLRDLLSANALRSACYSFQKKFVLDPYGSAHLIFSGLI